MDYHDGKYGVNTDPQRGADTFIPFSKEITAVDSKYLSSNGTITFSIGADNFDGFLLLTAYSHYPCMSSISTIQFSDPDAQISKVYVDDFMFENASGWGGYVRYGMALYKITAKSNSTITIPLSGITAFANAALLH